MLYIRYTLSSRKIEDLLYERCIDIGQEKILFWWLRYGPMVASVIRHRSAERLSSWPQWRVHLDEIFVKMNGEGRSPWLAVDHEGEVLESFVTKNRDKKAALKFWKQSRKSYGRPNVFVIDKLQTYGAALDELGAGNQ